MVTTATLGGDRFAAGFEADDVFEEWRVEFDGYPRAVLATAAASADEDDGGFAFGGDLGDRGGPDFGIVLGEGRKIGDEDLVDAASDFYGDGGDV
jgi:hypothetical protein